jgi:hypothetical protein
LLERFFGIDWKIRNKVKLIQQIRPQNRDLRNDCDVVTGLRHTDPLLCEVNVSEEYVFRFFWVFSLPYYTKFSKRMILSYEWYAQLMSSRSLNFVMADEKAVETILSNNRIPTTINLNRYKASDIASATQVVAFKAFQKQGEFFRNVNFQGTQRSRNADINTVIESTKYSCPNSPSKTSLSFTDTCLMLGLGIGSLYVFLWGVKYVKRVGPNQILRDMRTTCTQLWDGLPGDTPPTKRSGNYILDLYGSGLDGMLYRSQ